MPLRVIGRSCVALATAMALFPAAAQAHKPKVLTQGKPAFAVRPAVIGYTGDGTGLVGGRHGTARHPGHLHWFRYTAHQGRARGAVYLNACRPSCAQGRFHAHRARVRVFRPRHGHFTRLTLRFRYHGRAVVDRRGVRRFNSAFVYAILR